MTRLPFDPDKLQPRQPIGQESGANSNASSSGSGAHKAAHTKKKSTSRSSLPLWHIAQLASKIKAALDDQLPQRVRVIGEISGSRKSTHLYFGLKDESAFLSAVMFASSLRKLPFEPCDGLEVIATGRVEFYEPQGRVSLIVEKLEPVGAGAHEIRFRQLCEELRALGWFDQSRKQPLPIFPRRVAVITSPTGAALQDVLSTMLARCAAVAVGVVPVRVQGEHAARETAQAIRFIHAQHARLGIDAIILTRGGGSPEDLAAFNDKDLASAIVSCSVPIVAAIGHETDTSIAELVADRRCATPTQAAVVLTPDRRALNRQLDALLARMSTDLSRTIRDENLRLERVSKHPVLTDPHGAARLARAQLHTLGHRINRAAATSLLKYTARTDAIAHGLDGFAPETALTLARVQQHSLKTSLVRALGHSLDQTRLTIKSRSRELGAVGPMAVLARGYSCTQHADGRVVREAQELVPGETIRTWLAQGSVESAVVRTTKQTLGTPEHASTEPDEGTTDEAISRNARAIKEHSLVKEHRKAGLIPDRPAQDETSPPLPGLFDTDGVGG